MPLTTSYFAVARHIEGKKISVARFHLPYMRKGIDEFLESFAPSKELLRDYKQKEIKWDEYRRKYSEEQRQHYRCAPEDFEKLLKRAERENLVLLCYEKHEGHETKCHRLILFEILRKVADAEGYEVNFVEEKPFRKKAD